MSLILDALRKMEQERKARRSNSASLRSEVLSYRGNSPNNTRFKALPITAAILSCLVLAGGGYYFTTVRKPLPPPVLVNQPAYELPVQQNPAPMLSPVMPASAKSGNPPPVGLPGKREQAAAPSAVKPSQSAIIRKNGDNGITLSGIAWQDERHLRRAVINGFLMEEGAEVQGAKIVEIREGSVRLSKGGELFEVTHNSGEIK